MWLLCDSYSPKISEDLGLRQIVIVKAQKYNSTLLQFPFKLMKPIVLSHPLG